MFQLQSQASKAAVQTSLEVYDDIRRVDVYVMVVCIYLKHFYDIVARMWHTDDSIQGYHRCEPRNATCLFKDTHLHYEQYKNAHNIQRIQIAALCALDSYRSIPHSLVPNPRFRSPPKITPCARPGAPFMARYRRLVRSLGPRGRTA